MDTLAPESLNWALEHLKKFGDTDIFPVPFEIEAIEHGWVWLQKELVAADLDTYRVKPVLQILVPKPGGGFRVATRLDPIDSVIYTALVYEAAEAIEKSRVPVERRIACSYRISLDPDGTFFRADNGWPDYQGKSAELAQSDSCTHVLLADISDFYNQIYQHRLENALGDANIPESRARNIAGFLSQLTATQSQGIPVGPFASIVLAEACLNDVDNFLLHKGYHHVRYVDDFRIFCNSRRQATRVLHDLSHYLYTSQRLSIEPSKIRMLTVEEFLSSELFDPQEEEKQGELLTITKLTKQLKAGAAYGDDDEKKSNKALRNKAVQENLVELFKNCLEEKPLHLGLARHVLRRAAQLRTGVLLPHVFDNLEALAPVLRDVAKYVRPAMRQKTAQTYGAKLLDFLNTSDVADIPYVRMWCLEMVIEYPALLNPSDAFTLAERFQPELGLRPAAHLARSYRRTDWVRAHKETWSSNKPWDMRAIIWAGAILPADERRHWLNMVQDASNGLERAIAQRTAVR